MRRQVIGIMEIFEYSFMQRALAASFLIGVLCSIIGVYVVLKGMSFIGAGIAHASFGGVALGYLMKINPLLSAIVFSVATALCIGKVSRRGAIKEDTAVGIFFSATMAFGVLCIGLLKGYNVDLMGYLFGSILAVSNEDLILIIAVSAIVLPIIALFFKELEFVTFDPEVAQIMGLPVRRLYYCLLALIALTVVASMKLVGIVLASALIITPAASAYQFAEDFKKMMVLSVIFGIASCAGGLILSYYLNTASGATIVTLSTVMFFISALISPKKNYMAAVGRFFGGLVKK
ncbi:MAG: metal ABC transporter permease [bacterium]|nr:metal ABC transporter permease [bacterium]